MGDPDRGVLRGRGVDHLIMQSKRGDRQAERNLQRQIKRKRKREKLLEKKRRQALAQQGTGPGPVMAHEQHFDDHEKAILKAKPGAS